MKAEVGTVVRPAMRICCVVLLLGVWGCRAHVELGPVPDESAPLAERIAAYEELAPQRVQMLPAWGPQTRVVLRSGAIVDDPLDLRPAVPPESATMRFANEARAYDDATKWAWVAAGTIAFIGIAGELGAGVASTDAALSEAEQETLLLATGGFAIVGLIGALAFAPAGVLMYSAGRAKADAFAAYERDLRKKLALKKRVKVTEWDDARLSRAPDPVE